MFVKFDVNKCMLSVQVGPLEHYKPTKKMKELFKKSQSLKEELNNFIYDTWGKIGPQELQEKLEKNDKEAEKWKKYLDDQYAPKAKELIEEVNKLNEKSLVRN